MLDFRHTHINVDKTLEDIRYVQNALGHPHERKALWRRFEGPYEPKLIFSGQIPPESKKGPVDHAPASAAAHHPDDK